MSSLENALGILDCYSSDRPTIGVTEAAEFVGLPKSSVSRLMKAMAEAGLLEPSQERRGYCPGPLAFRLGNLYLKHDKALELVDNAIGRLVDEFGLTGYFGVLDGSEIVLVGVRQGTYPVRLVLPKGARLPAHVTAIGQVLLARYPDSRIQELYPNDVFYDETEQAYSASEILSLIRKARNDGYAVVEGRTYRGFNAIGAAVSSEGDGHSIGFSLSCPQELETAELHARKCARMIEEAAEIGAAIGDNYWLRRSRRADRSDAGVDRHRHDDPDFTAGDELLPG